MDASEYLIHTCLSESSVLNFRLIRFSVLVTVSFDISYLKINLTTDV